MAITAAEFDYIRDFLIKHTAIALDAGKEYLVEMRLFPLARSLNLNSIGELIARLKLGVATELKQFVVEAMTTHETSFFRDLHPFDALRTDVLPPLLKMRSAEKKLSIWCGACSTGQEPYTIAMMLREHFPQLNDWRVQILATDLSESVLAQAARGEFKQLEINRGLPAQFLVKYFRQEKQGWKVKDEIVRMIEFRQLNLIENWTLPNSFDVVFMRNVLIYFSVDTKRLILGKIARLLRPESHLFLGASETTLGLDEAYERRPVGKTIAYGLAQKPQRSLFVMPSTKAGLPSQASSSPSNLSSSTPNRPR